MSDKILMPHTVYCEDRKSMTVTGVLQVVAYDEYHIVLNTDYGRLKIQGRDLIAGEISSRNNTLKLTGNIDSLVYKSKRNKGESIFAKMMR